MKYYTHLWNSFRFIVTPLELKNVLKDFHFVTFTRRVPADYIESDRSDFFERYNTFYDKLSSGQKLNLRQDAEIVDIATAGIAKDLKKCTYSESFQDIQDGNLYKISDFEEPQVGTNLFTLRISDDKKLSTKYSYVQFPEFIVGLEINYPKKIIFRDSVSCENGDVIKLCTELESYEVYTEIRERIKGITKKLAFKISDKDYKTTIRVSESARRDFLNFYFSKYHRVIE